MWRPKFVAQRENYGGISEKNGAYFSFSFSFPQSQSQPKDLAFPRTHISAATRCAAVLLRPGRLRPDALSPLAPAPPRLARPLAVRRPGRLRPAPLRTFLLRPRLRRCSGGLAWLTPRPTDLPLPSSLSCGLAPSRGRRPQPRAPDSVLPLPSPGRC